MFKEFRQRTAEMTPQGLGHCWELESSGIIHFCLVEGAGWKLEASAPLYAIAL